MRDEMRVGAGASAPAVTSGATVEARAPTNDDVARERLLADWFRSHGSALIGFSGGVDSAYLACVAVEAVGADRVLAVIGRSASYPAEQWAAARDVAAQFSIPVLEVSTHEMDDPRYAANPANRCYFCKTELWDRLVPLARERGLAVVVDGTNADDVSDYRPGARAAAEHGVRSPLAELGFTKAAIRRLSRARGLPTWAQPAAPCLSSRIPYGTAVTIERLRRVERAERSVRALGIGGDLRVRYHAELARVELGADVLDAWLSTDCRARLRDAVASAGFERVALDLAGFRSGSLNVLGGVTGARAARDVGTRDSGLGTRDIGTRDSAGGVEGASPDVLRAGSPRPGELEQALDALGAPCAVEVRGRLAIVLARAVRTPEWFARRESRASSAAAARACGFTHVALELQRDDAALRRG